VKLERFTTNKDGKAVQHTLAHAHWPAESVAVLESLFTRREQQPPTDAPPPPPPPA
jgi:hypothetical protein